MWKQYVNSIFFVMGLLAATVSGPVFADEITTTTTTDTTYQTVAEQPMMSHSLGVLHSDEMAPSASATPTDMAPSASPMPSESADPAGGGAPLSPTVTGNVRYITGGIGDEERAQLDSIRGEYNLHVLSAAKSGAFLGDASISVVNHKGEELISTPVGPIFYAALPAGSYVLKSTVNGQTKEQKVTVGDKKPSSVHFAW